jgi:ribosomal protein S18 acetylase RimI-like enzyme
LDRRSDGSGEKENLVKPIYWHSIRTPANRRVFVARVHLEPRLDGYEITSLCVSKSQRGKGYGSAILRKVCDDADAEGFPLYIVARPFDESPMTRLETVAWYQRAGFTGRRWGFQKRERTNDYDARQRRQDEIELLVSEDRGGWDAGA